ncbi:MAG: aminotransferase class III-fold pyridoxal phosphate-dependent enzyme, partial [bacterium]
MDGRPNVFFGRGERVGGDPLFVERARGAYVWDADGNRYIDFLLGYGSVVLGHAHPAVVEAV